MAERKIKSGFCKYGLLAWGGLVLSPALWAQIVVGQSLPVSGVLASLGSPLAAGAQAAIDEANAAGGIGGVKIKLVTLDDGFDPEKTTANVRELIQQHRAVAIMNVSGAPNTQGLVKNNVLSSAGVALVGPYTASTAVRGLKSPLIYFTTAGAHEEAVEMVRQAKSMGFNRLGVMYQNDLFGKDGLAEVHNAAKEAGVTVVGEGAFERNAENIDPAVEALGKSEPQAIFMFAPGATSAKFVAQYRKKYGARTMLVSSSAGSVEAMVAAAGKEGASGVGLVQVVPNPTSATMAISKDYRQAMEKFGAKGWQPSSYALQGYITARVVIEALNRAGNKPTPGAVTKALDSLQRANFGGVEVDFSNGNRQGVRKTSIGIISNSGRLLN